MMSDILVFLEFVNFHMLRRMAPIVLVVWLVGLVVMHLILLIIVAGGPLRVLGARACVKGLILGILLLVRLMTTPLMTDLVVDWVNWKMKLVTLLEPHILSSHSFSQRVKLLSPSRPFSPLVTPPGDAA